MSSGDDTIALDGTVEGDEGDTQAMAARSGMRKWLRLAARIAVIAIALPILLTPVYRFVPPISTLMLWDLMTFQGYSRSWVSLDDISPNMVQSVIMGEDGKFCSHDGVDWDSLMSVLKHAGKDGPSRGASTITMQTVKNVYLWNSRSYARKALEIPLALYTNLVWQKRRTMEIYLNIAELGPNLYGVEAASRAYFNKPASQLSRHEAALIAAALPNPALRNPKKPSSEQKIYARTIERRAAMSGAYVTCIYD
ncbi:monofunctional biosynthetic peptidoglycan transglycosylase [Oryzibacter oryziterrae]|uniref:monofunctional biosynthetic peptidoglycan transglycosylase n=1 Tax=Oryzibacter oryziterrae TaxID=2766474 RepID=UPI001F0105CD|nr:monofunctional biosynthetic peptidoglycan transglycosylase [Oryzibacter oryziterrae]